MSLVSERTATFRRQAAPVMAAAPPSFQRNHRQRPVQGRGRGYSQSEVGGERHSERLIPHFSAIANEGAKRPAMAMDEWGENTTVVTGVSEQSGAGDNLPLIEHSIPPGRLVARRCSRMLWLAVATLITLLSVLSAPVMVVLPYAISRLQYGPTPPVDCPVDCQGYLLQLLIKTALLVIALWAIYWRRAVADLPRLFLTRAALAILVLFELFAFWLFYTVRILLEQPQPPLTFIVSFSLSLIDALLYTHYISVVALELRKHRPEFVVTITRDPDGECRTMTIGKMSIQEAAVEILRFYEASFPSFNYLFDRARNGASRMKGSNLQPGFKVYNIEGGGSHEISQDNMRMLMEAMSRRRVPSHVELCTRDDEWEARLRKRRYRLLASAEDAFAQISSVQPGGGGGCSPQHRVPGEMDAHNAADTVYPWIAKSLNKFLKLTRLQSHHTAEDVKAHIEECLSRKFSHRTFVQRYTSSRFPAKTTVAESKWSVLCSQQASAPIDHSLSFVLVSHDSADSAGVQLLCSIASLPFFNLTEQHRPKPSKYTIKISHEAGGVV